jgi:citrate lyase subunit beta/citryl-CoA lyase
MSAGGLRMRSLLFLPGNREKFLEKAADLDADGFIVDFEDSVPASEKAAARKYLAVYAPALREKSIWVRPNAPGTPHFEDDLAAVCGTPGIAGLMLPKAEDADALRATADAIGTQERAAQDHPDRRIRPRRHAVV